MQKAIAAIVGGIVSILSNFGFEIPGGVLQGINAAVPILTAVAVYFIPNKA